MTLHLDTSALVDALSGPRRSIDVFARFTERGDRPVISSIALFEWLRGPRTYAELTLQEELLPRDQAIPFGTAEADAAARICTRVRKPRGREMDIAIAACVLVHGGALWTLNPEDFRDIPDLRLV